MINTTWTNFLAQTAILLPAFLISVSFHECSHALTAYLLGDDTAKRQGRLTLNPVAHIDFMGLLFLLLFRVGWANPVLIDTRNFKHPRFYDIVTALAGPFSNFILAIASFTLLKHFPETAFSPAVGVTLMQILEATGYVNIMLGVFNILPIPPLDGGHILIALISKRFPQAVIWLYRYAMLILICLFMLEPVRAFLSSLIVYTQNLIQHLIF